MSETIQNLEARIRDQVERKLRDEIAAAQRPLGALAAWKSIPIPQLRLMRPNAEPYPVDVAEAIAAIEGALVTALLPRRMDTELSLYVEKHERLQEDNERLKARIADLTTTHTK